MRIRWLLAAVLLLLAPNAGALPDECDFQAGGNWTALGTHPSVVCTGGDNNSTIDADDLVDLNGQDITIPAGSTIDFSAGSDANAGCCVDNAGGGSLTFGRSDSALSAVLINGDGGMDLTDADLIAPASILRFRAQDPQNGAGNGATILNVAVDDVDPDEDALFVPDMIEPCPGTTNLDCGGATPSNQELVRFTWRESVYGVDGSTNGWENTAIDDMLRDVVPDHHLLCHLDLWDSYTGLPGEMNQCFRIAAVSAPAPSTGDQDYTLDIDVRQGVETNEGNPLERRYTIATTLAESVEPGERTISIAATTFGADCTRDSGNALDCDPLPNATSPRGDKDWIGAEVRFDVDSDPTDGTACTGGTCVPQASRVYTLQSFADGGVGVVDAIVLLDERGVSLPREDSDGDAFEAFAAGERVHITLHAAFETGDRFVIVDPARIETANATASHDVNPITIDLDAAGTDIGFLLLDRVGAIDISGTTGCPADWDYLYVRDGQTNKDATVGDGNSDWVVGISHTANNCIFGDLFHTGVDAGQEYTGVTNTDHGIWWTAGAAHTGQTQTWRHISQRHHGDDCLVAPDSNLQLILTGLGSCEHIADDADSGSYYDWQGSSSGTSEFRGGILCTHCIWDETGQEDMFQIPSGGGNNASVEVTGLFWLGSTGHLGGGSVGRSTFEKTTAIEIDFLDVGSGDWLRQPLDGCRFRDISIQETSSNTLAGKVTTETVKNCYMSAFDWPAAGNGSRLFFLNEGIVHSNVFYERFTKSGGGSFFGSGTFLIGFNFSNTLEYITLSEWPDEGPMFNVSATTTANPRVIGPAAIREWADNTNFLFDGTGSAYLSDEMTMSGAICAQAANPADTGILANITSDQPDYEVIIGEELGLEDPEGGDYGSGPERLSGFKDCGAKTGSQSPGIHVRTWPHMILGIEPECSDPPCVSSGGGGGGDGARAW